VIAADVAGLARLRHWGRRLAHDDETLLDRVVTLYRSTGLVGRIVCSTVDLASQAERICCGIRYRRANEAAYLASELALDEPMALAA
jgi:hypothetical protein